MRAPRAIVAGAASIFIAACAGSAPDTQPLVVVLVPAPLPQQVAAPEPIAAPEAEGLLGHWEGVGRQDSGSTWAMEVDLHTVRPGVCGKVRYPTIPCAAEWICAGQSDGRTLHARERLTEHPERCIDAGEMTMELTPDGALEWTWSGGGESAHARLARGKRRPP
jgi:hypothetical protein